MDPLTLVRNADGTYTERTKDGIEYRYDGYWAKWRHANQSPTAGRRLLYAYDERGRLREVVNPIGARWRFEYDSEGRLVKGETVVQYYYEVCGQVWAGVMGPYNRYAFTGKDGRTSSLSQTASSSKS